MAAALTMVLRFYPKGNLSKDSSIFIFKDQAGFSANCKPVIWSNGIELSLVGTAHPTADKGLQPLAQIDFNLS